MTESSPTRAEIVARARSIAESLIASDDRPGSNPTAADSMNRFMTQFWEDWARFATRFAEGNLAPVQISAIESVLAVAVGGGSGIEGRLAAYRLLPTLYPLLVDSRIARAHFTLTEFGGLVPVQGEGSIGGRPWYFRSRFRHWTVQVAARLGSDPVVVGCDVSVFGPDVAGDMARGSWQCDKTDCTHDYCAGYLSMFDGASLLAAGIETVLGLTVIEERIGVVEHRAWDEQGLLIPV
jgi:hypothetical protein